MTTRNAPGVDINEVDESQYVPGQSPTIGAMGGIAERGPVQGDPTLVTSWLQFKRFFGDLIPGSLLAYAAKRALDNGAQLYIKRVTALESGASTAVAAAKTLQTAAGGQTAGQAVGSVAGVLWQVGAQSLYTWAFPDASDISYAVGFKVDGAGAVQAAITAGPASVLLTNAATFALADAETILYRVGPPTSPIRTLTFHTADFVSIGAATDTEVVKVLARDMFGVTVKLVSNQITIYTDKQGTGARLEFTGGTALAALGLTVSVNVGSGNVADCDHVTSTELNTLIQAAAATVTFGVQGTTEFPTLTRNMLGSTASVQIDITGSARIAGAAVLGFDTSLHAGTSSSPVSTLLLDAESAGTWGNQLTVDVQQATNSPNSRFRLVIKRSGTVVRDENELSMNPTDARYVQNVFPAGSGIGGGAANGGDAYVVVTDLLAGLPDSRPGGGVGGLSGPPTLSAFASDTGTLAPGSYYYKVTALNANGETLPSSEGSITLATSGGVDVNWGAVSGATGYKIYGRAAGAELLIVQVGAVTTYHDTGSLTPSGALPLADSSYSPVQISLGLAFSSGNDGLAGIADSDYIGDSGAKTGLYAFDSIQNVSYLSMPGSTSRNVQQALFSYCENRRDIVGLGDVPQGLTVQQAKDFRMATGAYVGGSILVSTYGAIYHNWPQVQDERVKGALVYVPPTGEVSYVISRTDKIDNVWRAPAGPTRGKLLNVVDMSSSLGDPDVGFLYAANVNCLINDPIFGPVVDGQKTLAATPSKLDRVNVRRGLIFMRESLYPTVKALALFEPNDEVTWRKLDRAVSPFCQAQIAARGLSAFQFVCDESTNPPEQVALHILTGKLYIKVIDTAEFIEIDVVLVDNQVDLKVAS